MGNIEQEPFFAIANFSHFSITILPARHSHESEI